MVSNFFEVMLMVKINGNDTDTAGKTVTEYLKIANYDTRTIVVEINEEIVDKAKYNETILNNGDIVEIISFMGGG